MNSNTQNKSQFWGQLLSNIDILSFLFPLINVCIKLILNTQCERGLCVFLFSIRRRQQSCGFWIFFFLSQFFDILIKTTRILDFCFFHLEFEFKNPDFYSFFAWICLRGFFHMYYYLYFFFLQKIHFPMIIPITRTTRAAQI